MGGLCVCVWRSVGGCVCVSVVAKYLPHRQSTSLDLH